MSKKEKERQKMLEGVKTRVDTVHGQTVIVKTYPVGARTQKQTIRCKGRG